MTDEAELVLASKLAPIRIPAPVALKTPLVGTGRGRDFTTPAWMSAGQAALFQSSSGIGFQHVKTLVHLHAKLECKHELFVDIPFTLAETWLAACIC